MKPPPFKLDGDRARLKELTLEQSAAVTPGRLMWCRGRKVLGYSNVAELPTVVPFIPKGADTIVLSTADFADVREWLR